MNPVWGNPKRQLTDNVYNLEARKQIRLSPDSRFDDQQIWATHSSPHSTASEEICYGMLPDDLVQLKWPSTNTPKGPVVVYGDGKSYCSISIDLQEEYGLIRGYDEKALGVLSKKTYSALKGLPKGTRIHAVVNSEEWESKLKSLGVNNSKGNKDHIHIKLNLILFGERSSATDTSHTLASFDRFLQDPIPGSIECSYENPQSLQFPGLPFIPPDHQLEIPLLSAMAAQEANDTHLNQAAASVDLPSLLADIESDDFYNSLPAHNYLSELSIDGRILTPLLSHQKEAVDFISRREYGTSLPERSLWQQSLSENGNAFYQHIITGAKSQAPSECFGGIIADEMGLGKTLSTLSAIVGSMNKAATFSQHGGHNCTKSTLVIVPSELLLRTWSREIEKHIYFNTIRYITYHGPERRDYEPKLSHYDIVLTTYGTVMAEFRKQGTSILYRLKWYRIVLDEAHTIRNSSSKQFQAVRQISSHLRWCLTGTPIQNSLDDLASLVRFLQVPILDDSATFRKYISNPAKGDFQNLRLLLSSICLRRNRSIVPNMDLTKDERRLHFTSAEREQYHSLELAFKRSITFATKSQGGDSSYHTVMEALLHLRMFCNNGLDTTSNSFSKKTTLGLASSTTQPDEVLSVFQQSNEAICSFCSCDILTISGLADSDTGYMTRCLRLLCHECAAKYRHDYPESGCPLCHKEHGIDDHTVKNSTAALPTPKQYPSKIVALVRDVEDHCRTEKCVIFSFWKRTLDVAAKALEGRGIKFARIDGDITPTKRNNILDDFQRPISTSRVLLMTFSTGSVGLNGLTVASRVHILEPQWNPAVEKQAIGRILRIDQARKVTVIQYTMRCSIEEAVQSRQLRKMQLAKGGFNASKKDQRGRLGQVQQLEQVLLRQDQGEPRIMESIQ